MSSMTIKTFRDEANEIYQRYDGNFAGRARATRDLNLLDEIIDDLQSLIERGRQNEQIRNTPAFLEALEGAMDSLQTYQNERAEIIRAKESPHAVEAATLAAKANRIMGIYGRHFAGQSRATRDVRLLEDVIFELEKVREPMERLASQNVAGIREDLNVVKDQLQVYKNEINEIQQVQTSSSDEERASILASLANSQFKLYNDQFAGKNRASRRPGLLMRIVENLNDIRDQMRQIQEGSTAANPTNTNNIDVVVTNLRFYENELGLIKSARAQVSPVELAGSLGESANALRDLYSTHFAGQSRATRDLDLLSTICDGLWEIARQMEDLEENEDIDFNARNLEFVTEWWGTYEREWTLIQQAKTGTDA